MTRECGAGAYGADWSLPTFDLVVDRLPTSAASDRRLRASWSYERRVRPSRLARRWSATVRHRPLEPHDRRRPPRCPFAGNGGATRAPPSTAPRWRARGAARIAETRPTPAAADFFFVPSYGGARHLRVQRRAPHTYSSTATGPRDRHHRCSPARRPTSRSSRSATATKPTSRTCSLLWHEKLLRFIRTAHPYWPLGRRRPPLAVHARRALATRRRRWQRDAHRALGACSRGSTARCVPPVARAGRPLDGAASR